MKPLCSALTLLLLGACSTAAPFDPYARSYEYAVYGPIRLQDAPAPQSDDAGAVAKELANPTNALGKLSMNLDHTAYDGSLPGAGDQSSQVFFFQPALPVPQKNGKVFFARPGIPVILNQPVYGPAGFEDFGADIGDIGFDVAYGGKFGDSGLILLGGLVGTIPTATDDTLGKNQWSLGPEFMVGKLHDWGAYGLLLTHQWDIASTNDSAADVSTTGGQYFYTYLLGGGWAIGAGPQWSYNWEAESENRLTLPLATGASRTVKLGDTPWKFSVELWYYLESPDPFGPDWQLRINATPVLPLPW